MAWSKSVGGAVYGSPAVGFGAVWVIGAAKLHAFEAATGAARFVTDFGADPIRAWGKTAGNALGDRQDVARP